MNPSRLMLAFALLAVSVPAPAALRSASARTAPRISDAALAARVAAMDSPFSQDTYATLQALRSAGASPELSDAVAAKAGALLTERERLLAARGDTTAVDGMLRLFREERGLNRRISEGSELIRSLDAHASASRRVDAVAAGVIAALDGGVAEEDLSAHLHRTVGREGVPGFREDRVKSLTRRLERARDRGDSDGAAAAIRELAGYGAGARDAMPALIRFALAKGAGRDHRALAIDVIAGMGGAKSVEALMYVVNGVRYEKPLQVDMVHGLDGTSMPANPEVDLNTVDFGEKALADRAAAALARVRSLDSFAAAFDAIFRQRRSAGSRVVYAQNLSRELPAPMAGRWSDFAVERTLVLERQDEDLKHALDVVGIAGKGLLAAGVGPLAEAARRDLRNIARSPRGLEELARRAGQALSEAEMLAGLIDVSGLGEDARRLVDLTAAAARSRLSPGNPAGQPASAEIASVDLRARTAAVSRYVGAAERLLARNGPYHPYFGADAAEVRARVEAARALLEPAADPGNSAPALPASAIVEGL